MRRSPPNTIGSRHAPLPLKLKLLTNALACFSHAFLRDDSRRRGRPPHHDARAQDLAEARPRRGRFDVVCSREAHTSSTARQLKATGTNSGNLMVRRRASISLSWYAPTPTTTMTTIAPSSSAATSTTLTRMTRKLSPLRSTTTARGRRHTHAADDLRRLVERCKKKIPLPPTPPTNKRTHTYARSTPSSGALGGFSTEGAGSSPAGSRRAASSCAAFAT